MIPSIIGGVGGRRGGAAQAKALGRTWGLARLAPVALAGLALAGLALAGCQAPEPAAHSAALRAGFAALEAARSPGPLRAEEAAALEPLAAVLARDAAQTLPRLGGRRFATERTARTFDATGAEQGHLVEQMDLQVTGAGDFFLDHRIEWGLRDDDDGLSGRRCWRVAGRWYVSASAGPITEVPVLADEPAECLRAPTELLTGSLAALWPHLAVTSVAPAPEAGWAVSLARAPGAPPPVPSVPPGGEGIAVTAGVPPHPYDSLVGERTTPAEVTASLHLDAATGAVLGGALQARASFRKGERLGVIEWQVRLESRPDLGAVPAPQPDAVATPRARIYSDMKYILGDEPPDAGVPDVGTPEVSPLEVGSPDGTLDPGRLDAGTPDVGLPDDLPKPGDVPPLRLETVAEPPTPARDRTLPDPPLIRRRPDLDPAAPKANAAEVTP